MGAWGTALYSDDETLDLKENYLINLKKTQSHELAYKESYDSFVKDHGKNDFADEALFWFVLADVQYKYGKLLPEVKEKANDFFNRREHLELWEEQGKKLLNKRKQVLKELEIKINSPLPKERKIPKPFICQHNIGDVFAVKINDFKKSPNWRDEDYSKYYNEFYGKYFVFQIVGKEENNGDVFPYIRIFYWCDYEIPTLKEIEQLYVMPSPSSEGGSFFDIDDKIDNLNDFDKKRENFGLRYLYDKKNLEKYYIGNFKCKEFKGNCGNLISFNTLQRDFYVGYSQLKSINYKP